MFKSLVFSFVIFISVNTNNGFQTGAPVEVCDTLLPKHYNAKPQLPPTPYKLEISEKSISSKDKLKVTLHGYEDFKGFIIQCRGRNNETVGIFEKHPTSNLIDCPPGIQNTITHRDASKKYSITFTWKPDAAYTGPASFIATVVKSAPVFWTGIKSPVFEIK